MCEFNLYSEKFDSLMCISVLLKVEKVLFQMVRVLIEKCLCVSIFKQHDLLGITL